MTRELGTRRRPTAGSITCLILGAAFAAISVWVLYADGQPAYGWACVVLAIGYWLYATIAAHRARRTVQEPPKPSPPEGRPGAALSDGTRARDRNAGYELAANVLLAACLTFLTVTIVVTVMYGIHQTQVSTSSWGIASTVCGVSSAAIRIAARRQPQAREKVAMIEDTER